MQTCFPEIYAILVTLQNLWAKKDRGWKPIPRDALVSSSTPWGRLGNLDGKFGEDARALQGGSVHWMGEVPLLILATSSVTTTLHTGS